MSTTKNVSHKKKWNTGTVQVHVEIPPIPLIKSKNSKQPDKCCVKIKLCRDITSQNLGLYELIMAFFDNGDLEEFLLFNSDFNMTLEVAGTLLSGVTVK